MPKLFLLAALTAAAAVASPPTHATGLTPVETTWLKAAAPVLAFAEEQRLPVDIVVQPQDTPGQTPMGMAYLNGRCLLVLSMRGNPEAQAMLDSVEPSLRGPVVESIVAHELGHCWRHLHRTWGTLPRGLQEMNGFSRVTPEQADLLREMWNTRREEGFADLVGLAWTLQRHPTRYEEVHAWTTRLRADQPVHTGPHDTRVWVRLAGDKTRFKPGASIFEQAEPVWVAGLMAGE
jgi:hypothetical protein